MASQLPDDPKKRELLDPFSELFHSMNDFFRKGPIRGLLENMDELFRTPFPSFYVNVREKDHEHIITAELPGVKKEQIAIEIIGASVTITVKHEEIVTEENNHKQHYKRKESFQHLTRQIYLGHPVNPRDIKASFKNGLLTIRIPKQKGYHINIFDE